MDVLVSLLVVIAIARCIWQVNLNSMGSTCSFQLCSTASTCLAIDFGHWLMSARFSRLGPQLLLSFLTISQCGGELMAFFS